MELSCRTAGAPPLPVAIGTVYGALLNQRSALDALG
ncbi:TPA: 2-hydroxyhepta-2,4-diene-1,7-dioate isomerase, partial [Burkholderia vietnamiensis]|nr:2-hydroxyhepta-2,4-diene-1,7-dioate isomerase [Burkholderia vietnamiensis]